MPEELLAEFNTTCALSDLGAGVVLLPMILITACRKTNRRAEKKLWLLLFASLAASFFLGFVTHYYCEGTLFARMWIALYAAMLESAGAFFLLSLYRLRGNMPSRRALVLFHALLLLAYLPIMILESFFFVDMIRPFVIMTGVLGLSGFGIAVRNACRAKGAADRAALAALLPLAAALYWQLRREGWIRVVWAFDFNGITHLYIILALLCLFAASLLALRQKE